MYSHCVFYFSKLHLKDILVVSGIFLDMLNCEFIFQHLLLVYRLLHNVIAFSSWFDEVLNSDSICYSYVVPLTKEFVRKESLYSSKQSKTSLRWTVAKPVCIVRLGNILVVAFHSTTYRTKQFGLQSIKLWSVAVCF